LVKAAKRSVADNTLSREIRKKVVEQVLFVRSYLFSLAAKLKTFLLFTFVVCGLLFGGKQEIF